VLCYRIFSGRVRRNSEIEVVGKQLEHMVIYTTYGADDLSKLSKV
jgi:hypothetical protein